MTRRLIQLIPAHHVRDAAGSEVLTIEQAMREAGWDTAVYADLIDEELRDHTRPFFEFDEASLDDAVALYHFCGGTDMTLRFCDLTCRKAMIYHNITPGSFFEPYDKALANACDVGRDQLKILLDNVDVAIAHSEFSAQELKRYDFPVVRTIPFLFDRRRFEVEPDDAMLRRLEGPPVVLFVGRLVPNKAPDDFIRVAQAYVAAGYPAARFVQVGKHRIIPSYAEEVLALAREAGLSDEQLLLCNEVSESKLMACYRSADVFLSLSRHEGFCAPLIEAMRFGVPVLALRRAAVPETLGEAGMLFDSEDPDRIAELVAHLLVDDTLRDELRGRGFERLKRYEPAHWLFVLRVLLEQL